MNIYAKIISFFKKREQEKCYKKRVREIAMLVCQKKDYCDPEDQRRLIVDLDDIGIGFPRGGF